MEGIKTIRTEWDLSQLLKHDDDGMFEQKIKVADEKHNEFVKKWKNREDYLKHPEVLKEALDDFNNLNEKHANGGDVMYYFMLRSSQNQDDPKVKAKFSKAQEFSKKMQ